MNVYLYKVEHGILIQKSGKLYEYATLCVDDLAFIVKDPNEFVCLRIDNYKHNLEKDHLISYLTVTYFKIQAQYVCPPQDIHREDDRCVSEYIWGETKYQV